MRDIVLWYKQHAQPVVTRRALRYSRGVRNARASFLYGVSPIPGQASIVESNDLDAAFDADLIHIILAKATLRQPVSPDSPFVGMMYK